MSVFIRGALQMSYRIKGSNQMEATEHRNVPCIVCFQCSTIVPLLVIAPSPWESYITLPSKHAHLYLPAKQASVGGIGLPVLSKSYKSHANEQ